MVFFCCCSEPHLLHTLSRMNKTFLRKTWGRVFVCLCVWLCVTNNRSAQSDKGWTPSNVSITYRALYLFIVCTGRRPWNNWNQIRCIYNKVQQPTNQRTAVICWLRATEGINVFHFISATNQSQGAVEWRCFSQLHFFSSMSVCKSARFLSPNVRLLYVTHGCACVSEKCWKCGSLCLCTYIL